MSKSDKPIDECPKCGSNQLETSSIDFADENSIVAVIMCCNCDFQGEEHYTFSESSDIAGKYANL